MASIEDAHKLIRDVWETIKDEYSKSNPGKHLVLTESHRSPERQMALYKKGRKQTANGDWVTFDKSQVLTMVDGFQIMGAHNYFPSRAIDVAVVFDKSGKISWKEGDYSPLKEIAVGVGLEWGGTWARLNDYPHLEIPGWRDL